MSPLLDTTSWNGRPSPTLSKSAGFSTPGAHRFVNQFPRKCGHEYGGPNRLDTGEDHYGLIDSTDRNLGGIDSNSEVADSMEDQYPNDTVDTLNISGHGSHSDEGLTYRNSVENGFGPYMYDEDAERITKKLSPKAVVNVCACWMTDEELQGLADRLKRKVCGCDGTVDRACHCNGNWRCKYPTGVDPGAYEGQAGKAKVKAK